MHSITPSTGQAPSAHTKQYVFVDEYNRHKRLKVMRACVGCRKRKIRCDGALQNGPWPCGACVRLKLKCIPPTLDPDDDEQSSVDGSGQSVFSFQPSSYPDKSGGIQTQSQVVHDWPSGVSPPMTTSSSDYGVLAHQHSFDETSYQNLDFGHPFGQRLNDPNFAVNDYFTTPKNHTQFPQHDPAMSSLPRSQGRSSITSGSGDPQDIYESSRELAGHMGELSIDITSKMPYTNDHKKSISNEPTLEDADIILPSSVSTDLTARIPPEMMPSEERAMDYFAYFFDHVHPYVPVLDRSDFYEQWRGSRQSISPLLLEAIFACVAQYLDEPIEVRKWLALASKHEESFRNVPRLSTVQAMIILTKAREFIPRRGYFYRSWMSVKYMTTMATDLNLQDHHEMHRSGNTCTLSHTDCVIQIRIWQALFVLEIMVGAAQGRTDYAVEAETVEFDPPLVSSGLDRLDYTLSRRFTYLVQGVRNIRHSNRLFQTMRRYKKDWALDPTFVKHNQDLHQWVKDLPADLQIDYPDDGSPPWLGGDHFVAYLHAYYHLTIVMHHRPQMQTMLEKGDSRFGEHLEVCLQSASKLCRIQEALWRDFGMHGLQFMIRGINFTIYCVLTCTMLHLAAITSPDAVINNQAHLYFPRHMRILEHCLPSAAPEMQVQINALRDAFSADTSRPFELKPTLGLRSPSVENHPTPDSINSAPIHDTPIWSSMHDAESSKNLTPATDYAPSYDRLPNHIGNSQPPMQYHSGSYDMPSHSMYATQRLHHVSSAPQSGFPMERVISEPEHTPVWDPSILFNQWHTAFSDAAPPPQTVTSNPRAGMQPNSAQPSVIGATPTTPQEIFAPQQQQQQQQQQLSTNGVGSLVSDSNVHMIPAVTPVMWQDAFTTAYVSGHGTKRYREASVEYGRYSNNKRRN